MLEYMSADVNVTADIYKFFKAMAEYPSEEIIQLEQQIAAITL